MIPLWDFYDLVCFCYSINDLKKKEKNRFGFKRTWKLTDLSHDIIRYGKNELE